MKQFLLAVVLLFTVAAGLHAQQNKVTLFSQDDAKAVITMLEKSGFSGSVFISQNGKPILDHHTGFANKTEAVPNSSQLRYNIGSVGKTITAVLVMKLVEQGKQDLEKTVIHYLPETILKNADKIAVRQLLNMTSGLGDYFTEPGFDENKAISNKEIYSFVEKSKPVNDTPGLHLNYSNAGFITAGAILEKIYGKTYVQIVQEQLLLPAGIAVKAKGFVTGYEQKNGQWVKAINGNNPDAWAAAGGLFLCSTELHQLFQYIISGKYINTNSLQRMWQKEAHPEFDPPFVHYGLGWMVEEPGAVQMLGHNGGVEGFQSAFRYLPQDGLYISFLSNHGNGVDDVFMQVLLYWLQKKGVSL